MGGGGKSIAADLAVEQTHDALDDRDVGGSGVWAPCSSSGAIELLAAEIGIEVASRPTGRQRVVARVDVVGAHLEARHRRARSPECAHQPGGDGGLAVARTGAAITSRGSC